MNLGLTKHKLLAECNRYVEARIATAKQSMTNAQNAANEEDKSSAGDKYETGRAMMQIERDKAAQQLDEALKLKVALDQILPDAVNEKVTLGSIVLTSSKKFFIGIGIGKLIVDGDEFLVIGPASPIGKALIGLRANDTIVFNNEPLNILQVG